VADLIAVGGIPWLIWNSVIKPAYLPSVTIECQPKIYSHEQVVFGTYTPAREDYQVRLYVHPEDNLNKYYLQDRRWESHLRGTWADWARFGNPEGKDMTKPLPLHFRVFAALIRACRINAR